MLNKFLKVLALLFLSQSIETVSIIPGHYLRSPCPDHFRYQFDRNGQLSGFIKTECPDSNDLELVVVMSVGNDVEDYNGHIEVVGTEQTIVDDVVNRRPIYYRLLFPQWKNIPPQIRKISINGYPICNGTQLPVSPIGVVTTIVLKHSIRVSPQKLTLKPEIRTPSGIAQNIRIKKPFNFNPVIPSDPSKISKDNPFMNGKYHFVQRPSLALEQGPVNKDIFIQPITISPINPPNSIIPHFESVSANKDILVKPIAVSPIDPPNSFIPNFGSGLTQDIPPDVSSKHSFHSPKQPYPAECGIYVAKTNLIVHGTEIQKGSYPWLVSVFRSKLTGLIFNCGGSLITKRHVITAAHCVKENRNPLPREDLVIILGRSNIRQWLKGKMVEVERVIAHPDSKPNHADADIAIVVLQTQVEFSDQIRPICLWTGSDELESVTGSKGTVVGWGIDENGLTTTAEPKLITLPIVSQEQCIRSNPQFLDMISERTFCAGNRNGSGPCYGDSGSGLIMKVDGRWMLRGIVSMSLADLVQSTCDLSNYVVFCDTSKFYNWILDNIK